MYIKKKNRDGFLSSFKIWRIFRPTAPMVCRAWKDLLRGSIHSLPYQLSHTKQEEDCFSVNKKHGDTQNGSWWSHWRNTTGNSCILFSKTPKEASEGGKGDLHAKAISAGWRGSKLTFISTVSYTPHSVSVARYFNSPFAEQNVHPGVSSTLIKSGFSAVKWSCLTDVNRLCQNDVAKQPCWSAE